MSEVYIMKIGISNLRVPGASWKDTLEIAQLAEELGYSCITTGEAWVKTPSPPWRR